MDRNGEAFRLLFGGNPSNLTLTDEPRIGGEPQDVPGSFEAPYKPQSWEEAHGLPSGAHFYDLAGALRVRD